MENLEKDSPKTSINWYPGHMARTKREITALSGLIDIIIEVIDARIPLTSRVCNDFLYKPTILVVSKYDLCDKNVTNKILKELAKDNIVITTEINDSQIKKKIINECRKLLSEEIEKRRKKGLKDRKMRVLVIGIPNVGKSTLINNLANKKIAKTANKPGVTKQLSWIKLADDLELLDSPGILEKKYEDQLTASKLAILSSINEKILNYQDLAYYIYNLMNKYYPNKLKEYYKIDEDLEFIKFIEIIGRKKGLLLKGGIVDEERAYIALYNDFKSSKFGEVTLD